MLGAAACAAAVLAMLALAGYWHTRPDNRVTDSTEPPRPAAMSVATI
jgi:hypothetical protein